MKLENKHKAQAARAKARAKAARKALYVNILKWIGVIIVAAAIVALIVFIVISAKENKENQSTESSSVSAQDIADTLTGGTGATALNTTAGTVCNTGDKINLDYVGKVDGVEFEGGSSKGNGYDLTLGSGTFIPGFEDAVAGHEVGETFDINVTFPEEYPNEPSLAGVDAVFTVTINGVYQ